MDRCTVCNCLLSPEAIADGKGECAICLAYREGGTNAFAEQFARMFGADSTLIGETSDQPYASRKQ